jgi:uncharacterized lipoprotein YajG
MGRKKHIFNVMFVLAVIMLLYSCESQHKHYKSAPCPCEKNNKR